MKKWLSGVLVTATALCLLACGKGPTQQSKSTQTTATQPAKVANQAKSGEEVKMDYAQFVIDPAKIPQEKLNTTLYVGVSIRGLDNPYIVTVVEGGDLFCKYLDSIGQKYVKQVLDSGASNDKEVDNLRQFASKAGGNAILYIDPNESASVPSLMEALSESGGYAGTVWNRPDDVTPMDYTPNWVIHTNPDNVANGRITAEALGKAMGGKGKIFVIDGLLGNTSTVDRSNGLQQFLDANPEVKVVAREAGNWDTKTALGLVETWLNQYPDVNGIWCANDSMAIGAIQALDKAGLAGKVPVTGIDGTNDMIMAIKDGKAVATMSNNGYAQGGYTLAVAYAAWTGLINPQDLPKNFRMYKTDATLVNKENVAEFIKNNIDAKPSYDFSKPFGNRLKNQ